MSLRTLVAQLAPRRFRAQPPVWDGLYERFSDVPVAGPGFDGDEWIDAVVGVAERALADAAPGSGRRPLLSDAVTALADRDAVRILDFGGGAGTAYLDLRPHPAFARVRHTVVEGARLCARARRLFAGDRRIEFLDAPPAGDRRFDVVYLGSVIQYVDDYAGLFRTLAGYEPAYLVLEDVPAGTMPAFVTAQRNHPGSVIAYRFYALDALVDALARTGYRLHRRVDAQRRYRMDNFPSRYRLPTGCALSFARAEATR